MLDAKKQKCPSEVLLIVVPHLSAVYNLARWLVHDSDDAEDIVQEACLRAFKFWGGYQGGNARAWLLKIVRNTSYSFLERKRPPSRGKNSTNRRTLPYRRSSMSKPFW
jgi:RNA polymerase sigma factor (sigma-70 family)